MKKALALTLVLVLCLGLAACGQSAEPAAPAANDAPAASADPAAPVDPAAPADQGETAAPPVDYPTSDITFVVPNAAGGGNDLATRALIPSLEETLGVTIVPLNQGESGGAVAANTVMTAEPNGTVLYFNSQTLVTTALTTVTSIDLDQFQPVAQVVEDTGLVFVKSDTWASMDEFAAAARENTLLVATNGTTALWGVAASKLAGAMDVEFEYIPYDSGTPMLTALAAGEVDMCIVNPAEAASLVAAGKIVPLAVMSDHRLDAYPGVPTCQEVGIDVTYAVWRGVFTKAGVSEEILNILDEAFALAVESEEFTEYCNNASIPLRYRNHTEFTQFIQDEIAFYSEQLG